MSITDFVTWVENSMDQQLAAPASGEVIRTGIQPQVGMEDIASKKDDIDQDEIMGLDSHVRRLSELVRRMKSKGDKGQRLQDLTDDFIKRWEKIAMGDLGDSGEEDGLGDAEASEDQLNYMKDNQPLPEPPRSGDAIPGGKPPIS